MTCRSENPDSLRPEGKEEVQRALHKRLPSLLSSIRMAILEQLHGLHSERERQALCSRTKPTHDYAMNYLPSK